MKIGKILAILMVVYAGIVAAFEGLLGYFQPEGASTLVITTTDRDGTRHDRVLSRLEHDERLYVAANHWPRAWYRQALANPEVAVTIDGAQSAYRAVPATDAEHAALQTAFGHGLVFRILTGFPPRYFVRLDPA
ncbi:MAG: nitroreductase family deazaflavin-dependent oxidoreductase [Pseudomonadales bacterium]|nr:nitroreductase family deazaflavin-dependent oxidoreductase [Pseudomonadales bacterium]